MAFSNFIPQIWDAQMLLNFRAQATAAAQANRQYEGDAKVGNQVNITTAVDIQMKDYAGNGKTTTPDHIDNTQIQLLINQEKSFDFLVDDIDRRQAAGSLDAYTESAGISLVLDADSYVFSQAVAGAATKNTYFALGTVSTALTTSGAITSIAVTAVTEAIAAGTEITLVSGANEQTFTVSAGVAAGATSIPVVSVTPNFAYPVGTAAAAAPQTGDDAFNVIRDLRKKMNKLFVPKSQRSLFVNSEFSALLLGANSKLTSVQVSGDSEGLRNANIGGLLGFNIYESDNIGISDRPAAIAWHNPSMAFVSQIVETEAMRDVNSFSDRIRGLHVYGAKALRGGVGVATFGF